MHDFEDIRPYRDDEVRPVVDSLLEDEEFISAIARFRHSRLYRLLPSLVRSQVFKALNKELAGVDTVHKVQVVIEKYLDKLIEDTSGGLTQSGLDKLDPELSYLFISNHRDITMDPALVNYMLYHHGFDTLQIAIGDNLLKRPFLTELMKLNKSFIVKRSVQGREKLAASKQLSAYIRYCINKQENVWIAQREGRAKDGIDSTETAVLKMLFLSFREAAEKPLLHEAINALNIVPVSISYEYDPCDVMKAEELWSIDNLGRYEKDENTDVRSILNGMIGKKGAIHVSFGNKLQVEDVVTPEGIADLIDDQVINNYKLQMTNYLAVRLLQPDFIELDKLPEIFQCSMADILKKKHEFEKRLAGIEEKLRPYVLSMYANPAIRKFEYR